ncbi:MAG: redox-sensing transcriptional repressor Rex [Planctomycetota bacterium]|nr:redox-sensing transcriptional repressor Rex [Planctomycetota bacterium]MDA1142105.1 redox-sensing transcriptional repressor Rex [Planctomycetota bacterium]
MQNQTIPKASIERLTLYLRRLERLHVAGQKTISSSALGEALGLTDAQVRKDLTYFGQFGHPGIGYNIAELVPKLREILGLDRLWNVALVGVGNLGRALLHYKGLREQGFEIVAIFDQDPEKVGDRVNGLIVESSEELAFTIEKLDIELGLICVPAEAAQDVANALAETGIKGILNFAPFSIFVPERISLCSVDLALELEQLSFQVIRKTPNLEHRAS